MIDSGGFLSGERIESRPSVEEWSFQMISPFAINYIDLSDIFERDITLSYVRLKYLNVSLSAATGNLLTPESQGPENFIHLHVFCPSRKGSFTCRHIRMYHTGPRLYCPSNKRRNWGFSFAPNKPPTTVRIKPVATDIKAYALYFAVPRLGSFYPNSILHSAHDF